MIVGVVGAGTMGAGIAQVCLVAGHAVRLYDVSPEAVAAGLARIEAGLGRMVAKGRLEPDAHAAASARLTTTKDLADVAAGAHVVIEAAVEDLAAKRAIFAELDRAARAGSAPGDQHLGPLGDRDRRGVDTPRPGGRAPLLQSCAAHAPGRGRGRHTDPRGRHR